MYLNFSDAHIALRYLSIPIKFHKNVNTEAFFSVKLYKLSAATFSFFEKTIIITTEASGFS